MKKGEEWPKGSAQRRWEVTPSLSVRRWPRMPLPPRSPAHEVRIDTNLTDEAIAADQLCVAFVLEIRPTHAVHPRSVFDTQRKPAMWAFLYSERLIKS
jgi:hypothetical protein